MLKASELRVGNYLQNEYGDLCQVIEIGRDKFYAPGLGKGYVRTHVNVPIPLTREWLLKFGFKFCKDCLHYELNGVVIETDFENNPTFSIYMEMTNQNIRLPYVHVLQNWYFLLEEGEELQITKQE